MEENRWKQAFDQIRISPEDKEILWEQLRQKRKRHPLRRSFLRIAAMLAVVLCAGAGAALIVDGMTGGKLANALSGIWIKEESSNRIVEKITDRYSVRLDSAYAPEVIECSDSRILFANSFGLVVYDRQRQRVTGTIDLQKIQCNYFNADTLQTKFFLDHDTLTVYNKKGKKIWGPCYRFDLNNFPKNRNGIIAIEPAATQEISGQSVKKWEKQMKNRVLTWEDYTGEEPIREKMYSEYSVQWESGDHKKYSSFLVIEGTDGKNEKEGSSQLVMYHRRCGSKEVTKENLCILVQNPGGTKSNRTRDLPVYRYQGKDRMEEALVKCFYDDWSRYQGQYISGRKVYDDPVSDRTDLTLPLIDIVGVKKGKKYTKVYGTFRRGEYSLSGNTLYEAGEGGGIGAAYLKKTENGYQVKKILHPRDGGFYQQDLLKFCEGDSELVSWIQDNDLSRITVRTLKKYVKQNNLDIRYFKEFGWDPHKIG